jgi:hypothetical protein
MRKFMLIPFILLTASACGEQPTESPSTVGTAPAMLTAAAGSSFYTITAMTIGPKGALWMEANKSYKGFRWAYAQDAQGNYINDPVTGSPYWWRMEDYAGAALATSSWTAYNGGDISIASDLNGVRTSLGGMTADWSKDIQVVEIPAGATLLLNAQARTGCTFNGWSADGNMFHYVSTAGQYSPPAPTSLERRYQAVFYCSGTSSGGGSTSPGGGGTGTGTGCSPSDLICP